MLRKVLFFFLLIGFTFSVKAQLSDLHYLPPLKQGQNNAGIQQQAIHLSTPETGLFTVNVYRGTSAAIWNSYTINNTTPAIIDAGEGLTNGDNNITLVSNANTGVVLTNSGLRFESPSGSEFYVNYRGQSSAQAASLTSKGREAIGTNFRWGGVPNLGAHSSKSNTLGIMATQNNTTVTLSGYNPNCTFRLGNNADGITANNYTITLDAYESFVFENYVGNRNIAAHVDGWIGATILSDKDIVISNGAMNYGRQLGSSNRDAGIDQPVPVTNIGKDYVFIRGNGNVSGVTEFPLIIATADNTNIEIGGTVVATIDNGEYFQVPSTYYSGSTAGANMYIYTTKDTYAYQCLAGSTGNQTAGLNFIAPVNCLLPDVMDNIPDIRNIAGTPVSGNLTIIAAVNTPDANVQVFEDGNPIVMPASTPVIGTSNWKTFYIQNLDGNISAQSTGPMAVGFFGANGNQGVAGYFSGFDTVPEVILDIASGAIGDCFSDANIFVATANFDAYQWYYEGEPIDGANTINHSDTRAGDYFVRGTKGPCTYDSDPIAIFYCEADIAVTKSVVDPEIIEGETTVFTIRAESFGFEDVTNFQITEFLPSEVTLVSHFTTSGSWNAATSVWNVGTLEAGVPVTLELTVRGNEIDIEPLLNVTNTVSNTQDQIDANRNEDILSANLIIHNDFDNDGVIDIVDVDDDNDGVFDNDECSENFCFESIINESFESPVLTSNYQILNESAVPGWLTTATDSRVEFWRSGFLGVDSYNGNQHAELNANRYGALYQNLCLTPGTIMNWSLRHRGRSGVDEMQLRIGADLASAAVQQTMSTDNDAWVIYSGTYTVPLGQNNTLFIFEAISTASGSISVGNFIDDIKIDIAVPATCIDSDGDGYPNNIDLDRDNDGCTDADEWYKDNNADADDGGEFGSGVPVVDPNDGSVIAASYNEVLAPTILLQNTSEIVGVGDINGQDVDLGDIFDYVLRFQNTGDDNAASYTIRNVLPANVTLVNIDVSGAPIISNHDPLTNVITFQVNNSLIEVGDPEYTIRITVEVSGDCNVFRDACSENLENIAYSTYQGNTNPTAYSDEPGSINLPVCIPPVPTATNSLLNALASCDVPRTDLLCGDDIVLTAGAGFTTYTWAIDANGNGQIDASEPALNDGDPDGNPGTLLVSAIGDYIVEKSGATGCADRVELITVELFGSTQTNPIVDYFNQVNTDTNPNNDILGEIRTDCNDGTTQFADILLCGTADSALLQMNITDATGGLFWERLDESSCTSEPDGCLTRNLTCSWNQVETGSSYIADTAGSYRLSVTYSGGCFSRFYFNVFENNLVYDPPISTDILCSTDGNIRITGVPTSYGYQLVNADTNATIVNFSANNGPSFDIATSGNYRVQMTQLDPVTNDPIVGACIFETDPISILERIYDVTVSAEPADCSGFGEITVQALNVLPEYNYRIFISGTTSELPSNLGSTDNTHTFTGVPPGTYTIETTTDDGCTNSQDVTVGQVPDLDLSAVVSDQLTCNAGLISLSPSGGDPDPNYRMAIWSGPTGDLYSSPADALSNATFQNTNDFLFLDNIADEGFYEFIVFDSNDCHDISNRVELINVGPIVITESHTEISCAGSTTSTVTITATGGTAPYEYSRDGGTNYQTTNVFTNLGGGSYTITVRDSSGSVVTSRCTQTLDFDIDEPFALNASAALAEDIACDPDDTLVKILNITGGQAPYEYSFEGGLTGTFSALNERRLTGGNYQFVVRDNLGCSLNIDFTVPNSIVDPSLTSAVAYDCIGEGTIAINSSNNTDFNYTYSLDGGTTIQTTNEFPNQSDGTYTVTVGYSSALTPNQSTLYAEDFGAGSDAQIAEAGSIYCFEPQDGTANACNRGPAGILVNGEYTVTKAVTNTNPFLRSPQDHTGLTDGRFFAIDISTFSDTGAPQPNNILWSRPDIEVLPNQEITVNFWAYNLMMNTQTDPTYINPEVRVEILDNTGTIIYTEVVSEIPKNTSDIDWHQRPITFNPGVNTEIDIVFRTNRNDDTGNDLVLDDITVSQLPEICERTQDISVVVEANQAFEAQLLGVNEPSCNGAADGAIRFEISNFDATAGYEYTINDGTTTFGPFASTNMEELTSAVYVDGTYTITVYKADDNTCTTNFTASLTEPGAIVPDLQLTAAFTCFNTGATLEASATGGTIGYEYQLETTAGAIIAAYQTATTFTNVPAGDYLVRVSDANGCPGILSLTDAVTVAQPADVLFDTTPTACYAGASNGSILVDITSGNGNYELRIDGGPWVAPNTTATSHSFNGLSENSYDIEVRDQFGCPTTSNLQTVVISPQLILDVDVTPLSACADGEISVTATGGNGTLLYAIVPANTSPTGLFSATSSLAITEAMATANPAGYDVYVQDNNGAPALCTAISEDIILSPVTALTVNAVPTDPECFDGLGQVDITVSGGTGPFTYTMVDLFPADGIDYGRNDSNITANTLTYNGIGVGNYEVSIEDAFGCTITSTTVTINNAIEITADIGPLLPANCTSTIESDFGFEFLNIIAPTGTIEYSNNGGTTWGTTTELRGTVANPTFSGTEVFPSIRVTLASGTVCQQDFARYIIPFPLDDLDITLSAIVVGCDDLQVTVQGSAGNDLLGYDYTYTDDPANFNNFIMDPNVWMENIPTGTSHTFQNINPTTAQYPEVPVLVPGKTYVFYVRDGSGCIRQSNVNVNEIPGIGLPIEITADVTPSCDGAANGSITFNLNPTTAYPSMRWEIYELGNTTPIEVSGGGLTAVNVANSAIITTSVPLAEGDYYIDVIQVDGTNTDACRGGSENVYVSELAPLNATAVLTRDISCNLPGLISINGISGGGGAPYTYDVTGPIGFTALSGTANNPVQIPVNSPAGDYIVTLYDQYSCPLVLNTVTLALAPNPTIAVAQDNCAEPITVTATGASAVGNLRYALVAFGDPAPTTFDDNAGVFTNVSPGAYDIYVIDGNGCSAVETNFVVNPVLSASVTPTKLLDCTPTPEATIAIEVLDGSGSYEYSITNDAIVPVADVIQQGVPSNNFVYQAPQPGNYTVTIYDTTTPSSAICDREFVINIPERIEPIIDPNIIVSNVSCFGANDGSITISTTNGAAAPYTFEITLQDGVAPSVTTTPASITGNTATFTGLVPAITGYVITVTGDPATNNCAVSSVAIPVTEPTDITLTVPPVSFGCTSGNTSNNAVITANANNGSGTFVRYVFEDVATTTILQDGTTNTYNYTNLAGGDIEVTVFDDTGCSEITTLTIPPYDELQSAPISIVDPISCTSSGEDIAIDVIGSVTNFTSNPSNFEMRQLPSTVYEAAGDNTFNNLVAGTYNFGIRNIATGCEIFIEHVVADPNSFDVIVNKLSDVVCFGDDGSITLTFSDATYTGDYEWEVLNPDGTATTRIDDEGTFTGPGTTATIPVAAGNFVIRVIQITFPECDQERSVTIATPPSALLLEPVITSNVTCANGEGSAQISPNGGVAPYNITITNGTATYTENNVNAFIFNGLSDGIYNVTVTDALGCIEVFTSEFTLELPANPTGRIINIVPLECQGDNDATFEVEIDPRTTVITPSPTYNYSLNTYADMTSVTPLRTAATQSNPDFSNLGSGFYSVTVTDNISCGFETARIQIVEPTDVDAFLVIDRQIDCATSTADILLTASGGTPPYTWSTTLGGTPNPMTGSGGTTELFTVGVGTYTYFITDDFNCTSIISNEVRIDPIEPLTLDLSDSALTLNCFGEDTAVIIAEADGAFGEYEYALAIDNLFTGTSTLATNNDGLFDNLTSGSYYVRVRSRDCEEMSAVIVIDDPEPIVIDQPIITPIICSGDENGSVTINASGGTGDFQYAISPRLNRFVDDNTFDELAAGDYSIIVQDGNGCFELIEFTLEDPEQLLITLSSTPEICSGDEDGTITIVTAGGVAPYSWALNDDADFVDSVGANITIDNLASGDYLVFLKDENGCIVEDLIRVDSGANLNATIEVIYECTGDTPNNRLDIVFEDSSVSTDVLYAIDSTDPNDLVLEPNFENLSAGDHYLYIVHENGCPRTIDFEVEGFEPLQLSLEQLDINEITATTIGGKEGYTYYIDGQDNGNENTFYIKRTDVYTIRVVDENGCESISTIEMEFIDIEIPNFFTPDGDGQNDFWIPRNISQFPEIFIKIYDRYGREVYRIQDTAEGWGGLYQETELPTGDYWYVIKLNGAEDDREFVGNFTLYR